MHLLLQISSKIRLNRGPFAPNILHSHYFFLATSASRKGQVKYSNKAVSRLLKAHLNGSGFIMHCLVLRCTEANSFLHSSCSHPSKCWIKGGNQLEQTSSTILKSFTIPSRSELHVCGVWEETVERGRHGEYVSSTQKAPWRQALVLLDARWQSNHLATVMPK